MTPGREAADVGGSPYRAAPFTIFPPCSSADSVADDDCTFGRAVYFIASAWSGGSEELWRIARVHKDQDNDLHVLVREPVDQFTAGYLGRALSQITNGAKRESNMFFHREEAREWKKVWRDQKRFEAEADPSGYRANAKAVRT